MNAHAQQLVYLKDALRLTVKMGEKSMAAQQLNGAVAEIERLEARVQQLESELAEARAVAGEVRQNKPT